MVGGGGGLGEETTPSLSSWIGDPCGCFTLVSVLTTGSPDLSPCDCFSPPSSREAAAFEGVDGVADEAEFFIGVGEGWVVPSSLLPGGQRVMLLERVD